jgi:hypothetical protein
MTEFSQLQDGFHELFTYYGHKLQIKGCSLVERRFDKKQHVESNEKVQFISWDAKQIMVWESDMESLLPRTIHRAKFDRQPNFICSIVQVPKMKVFLASALDMTFKIFGRDLLLLESIHHEERAILQMEYDNEKDVIIASGASGISVWRLYRDTALDQAHIMEKLFSFADSHTWVTKMIYEPVHNRIYAIRDRSAQVLSLSRRAVILELRDIHESPLSVVCWYHRNQFYVTGCR